MAPVHVPKEVVPASREVVMVKKETEIEDPFDFDEEDEQAEPTPEPEPVNAEELQDLRAFKALALDAQRESEVAELFEKQGSPASSPSSTGR